MLNKEQNDALDCESSVWVNASAGTGKTTILVNRVIKLLVLGVDFKKILCITFTNSGALEMLNRIVEKIEMWSNFDDAKLKSDLLHLLNRTPNIEELIRARNLFNQYCENFKSLKIQTIHSFCQHTLKMFSVEAGISPLFKIIDDTTKIKIIFDLKKNLFDYKFLNQDLIESVMFVAENFPDMKIDNMIDEIVSKRAKFEDLFEKFADVYSYCEFLKQKFCLNENEYTRKLNDFILQISHLAINSLSVENQKDKDIVTIIEDYLGNKSKIENLDSIASVFLTKEDSAKRKSVFSAKFNKTNQKFTLEIQELQDLVFEVIQQRNSIQILETSKHFFLIAKNIIDEYANYKKKFSYLDYDDLIKLTKNLLLKSDMKDWVLYKLDGGIEHILLDESQDTNIEQWTVIDALIDDFFSGDSHGSKNKTIFVVGDEKQSVYSFQGSDINHFYQYQKYIKERILAAAKKYKEIDLNINYRSSKPIIDFVTNVFAMVRQNNPDNFPDFKKLDVINKISGVVELISLNKQEKKDVFWSVATNESQLDNYSAKIAKYVDSLLKSKIILPSTGKKIEPRDIMILFKKRNEVTREINSKLLEFGISTSGLDRIKINKNLAVLDVLSVAKFVLQPLDDLNLTGLLKSCFISLNEDQLHYICTQKSQNESIYNVITTNYKEIEDILNVFFTIYKKSNLSSFFFRIVDELGYRENLFDINPESNDAINEFLKISYDYSVNVENSIQSFVCWFESSDIELKRSAHINNELYITTVHSSKGLEAPVVILADSNDSSSITDDFIYCEDKLIIPNTQKKLRNEYLSQQINAIEEQKYKEYIRLLYVGLTRAKDRLIVFGRCKSQEKSVKSDKSWYDLLSKSFDCMLNNDTYRGNIKLENLSENTSDKNEDISKYERKIVYSVGNFDVSDEDNTPKTEKRLGYTYVKDTKDIEVDFSFNEEYSQHTNENLDMEQLSPLNDQKSLDYGIITHKILQDSVYSKCLIENHSLLNLLEQNERIKTMDNLLKIFENEQFLEILSHKIKTEVDVYMKVDSDIKIGRVDLLSISQNCVRIVDYKTDRNPPINELNTKESYKNQLKFYYDCIRDKYEEIEIKTYIVWTESAYIMEVKV